MRAWMICALAALVPLLAFQSQASAVNSVTEEHNGLRHTIQTDRYYYGLPEDVQISYSVTNITDEPIELGWAWRCSPLLLLIYCPAETLIWADPNSCPDEAWIDTLAVGASYVRAAVWDMRTMPSGNLIEEEGVYTVRGKLYVFYPSYYYWVDLPIEILDPSTPVPEESGSWGAIKALYE